MTSIHTGYNSPKKCRKCGQAMTRSYTSGATIVNGKRVRYVVLKCRNTKSQFNTGHSRFTKIVGSPMVWWEESVNG